MDKIQLISRCSILQFMHRLRSKQAGAWLLAAFWLLLNAQVAIANHDCQLTYPSVALSGQYLECIDGDSAICEQHCQPDAGQSGNANNLLVAIATETEHLLNVASIDSLQPQPEWQSPPIAGPPAEIRFCRFRE